MSSSKSMYYVEIRATQRRIGSPRLVSITDVEQFTGFRSVFAYPSHLADHILVAGTTRGLKYSAVYADTIFVDYDDEPDKAEDGERWLNEHGFKHSVWFSGNRSIHFHIPCKPTCTSWITQAMKGWVSSNLRPGDLSFYHSSGQFRLPGTVHEKTGKKKEKLREVTKGKTVVLKKSDVIPCNRLVIDPFETDTEALVRYRTELTKHVNQGRRSVFISCFLARDAYRAGISYDQAVQEILRWNEACAHPPHSARTVLEKVKEQYLTWGPHECVRKTNTEAQEDNTE